MCASVCSVVVRSRGRILIMPQLSLSASPGELNELRSLCWRDGFTLFPVDHSNTRQSWVSVSSRMC